MRRLLVALLAGALAVLAGCTDAPSITAPDASTKVDVDTPELREMRAEARMEPCPDLSNASGGTSALPAVTLPCLGGGPELDLRSLTGPAVIPVWAQWCTPCREELPWYERLHRSTDGRLTVLGVDWQDLQPEGALALAAELGVTFPSVADVDAELEDGARGLPLVYFVSAEGEVTPWRGRLKGFSDLADRVARHTGVTVSAG